MWQEALNAKTGQRTVPNVFVRGKHIGGCDDTFKAFRENRLMAILAGEEAETGDAGRAYDYDLIVIGGGSGGLAASKVIPIYSLKY